MKEVTGKACTKASTRSTPRDSAFTGTGLSQKGSESAEIVFVDEYPTKRSFQEEGISSTIDLTQSSGNTLEALSTTHERTTPPSSDNQMIIQPVWDDQRSHGATDNDGGGWKKSISSLQGIDEISSLLRVKRDENTWLFRDGKYEAKNLKVHLNPPSLPVLDTPEDGTLHVITGWRPSDILSDLCYRYVTQGMWESKKCGFLEDKYMMRKRGYKCNGVMVCPMMLNGNTAFDHSTEQEWGRLQSKLETASTDADILEMRTARNLFVTLSNPESQFCTATLVKGATGVADVSLHYCQGRPALRQVHATKEWFVGCTHYYTNSNVRPRHFFGSLRNFTDKAIGYLREMLASKKPLVIPGDVCKFVAGKKGRGVKRCSTHGTELIEYGTTGSTSGRCRSRMLIMEPIMDVSNEDKNNSVITFAISIGSHNHPPPPQADTTHKKKALFRLVAETAPMTAASVLKLQTQSRMRIAVASPMQNLNINRNVMYSTLQSIRRSQEEDDYTSMFEMVSAPEQAYVRDVRVIEDGVVFLLEHSRMLQHGARGIVFSGDATFKTVMESSPHHITPKWYLYNFVVPEDLTATTHKGVVVARALMTSLSTEAYTALWAMFLGSLRKEYASSLGLPPSDVTFDVPYMPLEPDRKRNAISVRSVTTDFEIAEVEGIAAAFAEVRGGSLSMHVHHLLVGCRVHFERAVLKRAAGLREPERAAFKDACRKLRVASSVEEADELYAIIHGIDNNWGSWLCRSHIRPLVSPPYSKMTKADRMMALDNTNIVESQNRRGNLICGTRMQPVQCAKKLQELDSISSNFVRMGEGARTQSIPRARSRNAHTLTPASASAKENTGRVGKKRKASDNANEATPRIRRGSSRNRKSEGLAPLAKEARTKDTGIENLNVQADNWLHGLLGERCRKALMDGDTALLTELSHLYNSVLQNSDDNETKKRIISTMVREDVGQQIVTEFTQLLFIVSTRGTDMGKDNHGVGRKDVSDLENTSQDIIAVAPPKTTGGEKSLIGRGGKRSENTGSGCTVQTDNKVPPDVMYVE